MALNHVMDRMHKASPRIKILILDACRNNPFRNARMVATEGLAPIHAPKGSIIAFSTSPGETARDDGFGKNSIYTGALLKHINEPEVPIEAFFKRVRETVSGYTKQKQTSWEHTSLIGEFSFNSGQLTHSEKVPYKRRSRKV